MQDTDIKPINAIVEKDIPHPEIIPEPGHFNIKLVTQINKQKRIPTDANATTSAPVVYRLSFIS